MGKIRIKTIGDEEAEKKQEEETRRKKEAKIAEAKAKAAEEKEEETSETKAEETKAEPTKEVTSKEQQKKPKAKFEKAARSKKYSDLKIKVDPKQTYSVSQALELLKDLQRAKFDETVELHINLSEKGVSGQVTLPHGTGKKTRVAIADDKLIAEIEGGKIEFDVLIAEPAVMPKLAKVARVLGPRGLMPNPKNGTISPKPEEVAKKYEGGQISFKTESKAPIIHLIVGKMSFGDKKLEENIQTILKAIKKYQVINATLKSTMSPGIKVVV
ncbi:50S ribosomal protein L1 [Patescibacteria group bacterium]|nr:50S ribosomal protein L1 [Patescibacteria group bacterium]